MSVSMASLGSRDFSVADVQQPTTAREEADTIVLGPARDLAALAERLGAAEQTHGQCRAVHLAWAQLRLAAAMHHIRTVLLNPLLVRITDPELAVALRAVEVAWRDQPTAASVTPAAFAVRAALEREVEGADGPRLVPTAWLPVHDSITKRRSAARRAVLYTLVWLLAVGCVIVPVVFPDIRSGDSFIAIIITAVGILFFTTLFGVLQITNAFVAIGLPVGLVERLAAREDGDVSEDSELRYGGLRPFDCTMQLFEAVTGTPMLLAADFSQVAPACAIVERASDGIVVHCGGVAAALLGIPAEAVIAQSRGLVLDLQPHDGVGGAHTVSVVPTKACGAAPSAPCSAFHIPCTSAEGFVSHHLYLLCARAGHQLHRPDAAVDSIFGQSGDETSPRIAECLSTLDLWSREHPDVASEVSQLRSVIERSLPTPTTDVACTPTDEVVRRLRAVPGVSDCVVDTTVPAFLTWPVASVVQVISCVVDARHPASLHLTCSGSPLCLKMAITHSHPVYATSVEAAAGPALREANASLTINSGVSVVTFFPNPSKVALPKLLSSSGVLGDSVGGALNTSARMGTSVIARDIKLQALLCSANTQATLDVAQALWGCGQSVAIASSAASLHRMLSKGLAHVNLMWIDCTLPDLTDETVRLVLALPACTCFFHSTTGEFPRSAPRASCLTHPVSEGLVEMMLNRTNLKLMTSGTAATAAAPATASQPYSLGRCVGGGGFGDVFEAYLEVTGGRVAVKRIFTASSPHERLAEVSREVDIMSQLSHPNIVRYLFCAHEDQFFCIFMELCEGDTLARRLAANAQRPLTSPAEVVKVISDVVNAVAYLHRNNIIHRDLKPENILFRNGVAKVGDFGSATRTGQEGAISRTIRGTLAYMAPEIMLGERYSTACDVWSIGCLLAEVLGIELPHVRSLNMALLNSMYVEMTMNDHILVPDELDIPRSVADLLERCLHRDVKRRPSAEEILAHPIAWDGDLVGEVRELARGNARRTGPQSFDMSLHSGIESMSSSQRSLIASLTSQRQAERL